MNLKQAEIILEKITRLYKTMKIDERNIDVFEQDLMLSYIRQLHESFSPNHPVSKRIKPILPPIEEAPKVVIKEPVKVTPPPKPKPIPPKVEAPKVVEVPKVEEAPKVVPPPPVPKPKPIPPTPKPKTTVAPTGLSAEERTALFEVREATELSEKLSQAPIRDLTKAMGLNEKIFTINELFGGESKVFDETVRKLNTFNSFEEAKEYLSTTVAHTYGWVKRNKKKKAINFINLVKRRYS